MRWWRGLVVFGVRGVYGVRVVVLRRPSMPIVHASTGLRARADPKHTCFFAIICSTFSLILLWPISFNNSSILADFTLSSGSF